MAVTIPYNREFDPAYGQIVQVSPLIRRIVAENPGPFTFMGTGTYIIGRGKVVVIDPGPDMATHVDALRAALRDEIVTHILVTHTHRDHSPASRPLKATTGALILGCGPHGSGREGPRDDVEEGADRDYTPDQQLRDGDIVKGDGWTIEAVHTPGHTSNHLCFALREEQALFPGDHVMGWSTTVVSPPDGDMAAYMRSLDKLIARDDKTYYPTHGAPIDDPQRFLKALKEHRLEREAAIVQCVAEGHDTIPAIVALLYKDVPSYLHPAAARSVLAHIIHLVESRRLRTDGPPGPHNRYWLP